MLDQIAIFWGRFPALLYGLSFSIGCAFYFGGVSALIPGAVLCISLIFSSFRRHWNGLTRIALSLLVFISGYWYTGFSTISVVLPAEGVKGTAILRLEESVYKKTAIGPRWFIKGTLLDFITSEGKHYYSLPINMMFSGKDSSFLPSLRTQWKTEGVLKVTEKGGYFLKISAKSSWIPLESSWKGYLHEKRQTVKEYIKSYIQQYMNNRSGPFIAGMVTGDFDDIVLRHQFGKFGLQHILAISGFHFSLLALALGIFLRLFLPLKYVFATLIALLTAYFFLLGPSPSVIRAWISITLALSAYYICRQPSGLNLLGISLWITLIFDPNYIKHMGFQFSFGITAGILLFSSNFEKLFEHLVPIRSLNVASGWNAASQHCYVAARAIKSTLALSGAVNIVAIPLILFHFQAFPFFSLIYNLFFPFLIGISLLLLIVGVFTHAVWWPLGTSVHLFNSKYTSMVMGMALDAPSSMNFQWYTSEISLFMISLVLTLVFTVGCYLNIRRASTDIYQMIF